MSSGVGGGTEKMRILEGSSLYHKIQNDKTKSKSNYSKLLVIKMRAC